MSFNNKKTEHKSDNEENPNSDDTESATGFQQRTTHTSINSGLQRPFGHSSQQSRPMVPLRDTPADERISRVVSRNEVPFHIHHTEYRTIESRVSSFRNWPLQIKQTPTELAEAGFFYTGSDDRVCCYVCDGKLRQWDANDDPWVEHYRWFSSCPLLGEQNTNNCETVPEVENEAVGYNLPRTVEQLEIRADMEELRGDFLQLGFDDSAFKKALQIVRKTGNPQPTVTDLLEAQAELQDDTRSNTEAGDEPCELLLEDNVYLRSLVCCVLCNTKDANILFLPCQHHRTCTECAQLLTECPFCKKSIKEKIKTARQL